MNSFDIKQVTLYISPSSFNRRMFRNLIGKLQMKVSNEDLTIGKVELYLQMDNLH